MEPYILTSSGQFFFKDPGRNGFEIRDIAGPLSRLCRFTGHTRVFYSVAQHSCHVADILAARGWERRVVLAGLLHDAAEAFLGDVSSPLKSLLGEAYRKWERPTTEAILEHFGLAKELPPEVHDADMISLATEKRDLMPLDPRPWPCLNGIDPDPEQLCPWSPSIAEGEFLKRYTWLTT